VLSKLTFVSSNDAINSGWVMTSGSETSIVGS
jgi:hypothetical protein